MAATSLPGEAFNSIRAGGVVVGVPLTHRHGLELALLASDLDARNLRGLYQVDYRYTFGAPASAARPFVHAGFAGGFSYNKYPEQRLVRPDQSAVVYPGFRQASLNAPQVASFGGGIGYRVKRVSFVTQGTFLCFNGCLVLAAVGARFGIGER